MLSNWVGICRKKQTYVIYKNKRNALIGSGSHYGVVGFIGTFRHIDVDAEKIVIYFIILHCDNCILKPIFEKIIHDQNVKISCIQI